MDVCNHSEANNQFTQYNVSFLDTANTSITMSLDTINIRSIAVKI